MRPGTSTGKRTRADAAESGRLFAEIQSVAARARAQVETLTLEAAVENAIAKALTARRLGIAVAVTIDKAMSVVDETRIREAADATPTLANRHLRDAECRRRDAEHRLREAREQLRDANMEVRYADGQADPRARHLPSEQDAPVPSCATKATCGPITIWQGGNWPVDNRRELWERTRHYDALWSKVTTASRKTKYEARSVLVVGNAGIGKSAGLNYLLQRAIDESVPSTLATTAVAALTLAKAPTSTTAHGSTEVPVLTCDAIVVATQSEVFIYGRRAGGMWSGLCVSTADATSDWIEFRLRKVSTSAHVLVLHDCKTEFRYSQNKLGSITYDVSGFHVTTVYAPSPSRENYHEYVKFFSLGSKFFMPTWDYDELEAVFPTFTSKAVGDAYFIVGGVPRHVSAVLHDPQACKNRWVATIDSAAQSTSWATLHQHAFAISTSNTLVRLVPNASYSYFTLDFVSSHAQQAWYKLRKQEAKSALRDDLKSAIADDRSRDLYERVFEAFCLSVLQTPDRQLFDRQLIRTATGADVVGLLTPWTTPTVTWTATRFYGITAASITEPSSTTPVLWVPVVRTFPVASAFLIEIDSSGAVANTLIRMTVRNTHSPTAENVQPLFDDLAKKGLPVTRIVWVVPCGVDFRYQSLASGATLPAYDNVPQFLVQMLPDHE